MSDEATSSLFNIAVATIFAREFLEGSLIIGNYRTAIIKQEDDDEETKKEKLKNVTYAAAFATFVAVLVILAVAIPLGILSNELDERYVEIIEGVSKVVGAIAILQLSLKIPMWLGCYAKVPLLPWRKHISLWCNGSFEEKKTAKEVGITMKEIRFNVAWNIWREVAECGVFLIPFFLGSNAKSIPLSALVGIAIALFLGIMIYIANFRMKSKFWVAFFMAGLMLFLSVGLFVGGLHEFEEVAGETRDVYVIENPNLSSKKLPMAIFVPFGYSSSRTVLQICSFWLWLAFGCLLHFIKWRKTIAARANAEFERGEEMVDEEKAVEISREETSSEEDNAVKENEHDVTA